MHFLRKRLSLFYNFYFRIRARRATGWELFYSKRLNLKLLLNLDNLIDFHNYAKESFEEEVLFAIDNLPIDGDFLFVDVGSQMGQFSLYVKKSFLNRRCFHWNLYGSICAAENEHAYKSS